MELAVVQVDMVASDRVKSMTRFTRSFGDPEPTLTFTHFRVVLPSVVVHVNRSSAAETDAAIAATAAAGARLVQSGTDAAYASDVGARGGGDRPGDR